MYELNLIYLLILGEEGKGGLVEEYVYVLGGEEVLTAVAVEQLTSKITTVCETKRFDFGRAADAKL